MYAVDVLHRDDRNPAITRSQGDARVAVDESRRRDPCHRRFLMSPPGLQGKIAPGTARPQRSLRMKNLALGPLLVGAIAVFGGLGYAADAWLKTTPTLLLVGLLLGVATGFYLLVTIGTRR